HKVVPNYSFLSHHSINTSIFTLSVHDALPIFKIAEGQWYRYAPSYVSPAYHLLEGFPFIQEPPSGDLQERVLIRHHDYDQKAVRSEERFSRNAETDLVCRLLLEKKDLMRILVISMVLITLIQTAF